MERESYESRTSKKTGGLDHLILADQESAEPGPYEIRVRWHASSLNYHDLLVANGGLPVSDGRIPMSDGAGEIDAVGSAVSRWRKGDKVMSLFSPTGRKVAIVQAHTGGDRRWHRRLRLRVCCCVGKRGNPYARWLTMPRATLPLCWADGLAGP